MTREPESLDAAGDPAEGLTATSDALLVVLRDPRATEIRKRAEPIGTAAFQDLAEQVEALSAEVYRLAAAEREVGAGASDDLSIDDVEMGST